MLVLRLVVLLALEDRAPSDASCASVRKLAERLSEPKGPRPGLADLWLRHRTANCRVAEGPLFARDLHPFIESLPRASNPHWLDAATLRRVLDKLLRVDGIDVSYARLSVEELGAIYECLLGIRVERLRGPAVRLRSGGKSVVARDVLAHAPEVRAKWLQTSFGLPKSVVAQLVDALARCKTEADVLTALEPLRLRGQALGETGHLLMEPGSERRRTGAHYTPVALTEPVVERTLRPLLHGRSSEDLLSLKICDPAAGTGAFLAQACRVLARALVEAWSREGRLEEIRCEHGEPDVVARQLVIARCLYGIDANPLAVELARLSLAVLASEDGGLHFYVHDNVKVGDALVGAPEPALAHFDAKVLQAFADARRRLSDLAVRRDGSSKRSLRGSPRRLDERQLASARRAADSATRALLARSKGGDGVATGVRPFHWPLEFPEVFAREPGGFDAFVSNPPWVAYAGRAAQPLSDALHEYYRCTSPAFAGYRTLQGLFVFRCASLLRAGGRLGLVLPTSVADLAGYAPTRRSHDALCTVDASLTDFGDGAFAGVFQPCMALTSTRHREPAPVGQPARRAAPANALAGGTWPLARADLDGSARRLFDRLRALPTLPAALFGERGYQTSGNDLSRLKRLDAPVPPYTEPLREGSDIREFAAGAPTLYADASSLSGRFRPAAEWQSIKVLIRQTARFPIAAMSDGKPFRNSVLAGFCGDAWSAHALVAYLNSSAARWYHYVCHRDARQGMPQLKVGHLRALPDPAALAATSLDALDALGRRLTDRNAGITGAERENLDALVFAALAFDASDRAVVQAWAGRNPPPALRSRRAGQNVSRPSL